ncbi:type II toxin-antitoxin system PemK/MazF family toxin [Iningainema tapete]|uniref:Type II toxin-antitoxin system PemK/MazF family toxin n=1 Tax=Iningainema tapete BLCC-T55 TaxID=2748662 RepID=A0A8J7BX30_9CYAN|nr:type II toxin-antitoxin system PemK/MazF family toxin [Iningainema tapete]MBD2772922.1 type II toxin-antitoxin system PemK/MazF family toxin [Iningainema tapete BLCC-T55]
MKGKVVLVSFPFDDLSATKVRPTVCLTNPIGLNLHIILALITSRISTDLIETDIILDHNHPDFANSGLHKPSTIRLDHLITLRKSMVQRELGTLSLETQEQIAEKLCNLFTQ